MLIILPLLPKTKEFMILQELYQQETTEKFQNFLANDSKDQFTGMNIKQKVRITIQKQIEKQFSKQNLPEN